jgi:hypothetical protein
LTSLEADKRGVDERMQATGERIDLAAVEATILAANNVEDWYREELLAEVRSLSEFYKAHSSF